MNSFDFFDQIYCISLPESTDRWTAVSKQFEAIGIDSRVEKCIARKPDAAIFQPKLEKYNYPVPTMVGCSLSHLKALTKALSLGAKNVLVFEDDVVFDDDINEKLAAAIVELPSDWDILYLGGFPYNQMSSYSKSLARVDKFWEAHAYALNQKCIAHICNTVIDNITLTSFDCHLSFCSNEELQKFCVYPVLVKQVPGYSFILGEMNDEEKRGKPLWEKFKP